MNNLALQHLGLLIEKVEHSGDVSFRWQGEGDEPPEFAVEAGPTKLLETG